MHDAVQGRDVLAALFDGCEGLLELRALPAKTSVFVSPVDLAGVTAFLRAQQGENCYWGVATRQDATGGGLGNCQHLPALFVDLDDKQQPGGDVLARRSRLPFAPSIVIDSGGGQHWYFLLRDPLDLQAPDDVALAYDALRRLAVHLGGDLPVAEPARILRVPCTLNHKYTPPRSVSIRIYAEDRRYNASDIRDWLPAVPTGVPTGAAVDLSKPIRQERNVHLYRLGRGLRGKGLAVPLLAEALAFINRRCCEPPLDDWEVGQIIEHVVQQPDRLRPPAAGVFSQTVSVEVASADASR